MNMEEIELNFSKENPKILALKSGTIKISDLEIPKDFNPNLYEIRFLFEIKIQEFRYGLNYEKKYDTLNIKFNDSSKVNRKNDSLIFKNQITIPDNCEKITINLITSKKIDFIMNLIHNE